MNDKINYALVLSGGKGSRFGDDLPKQFFKVFGKTILEYCVSGFNDHKLIDKIVVVVNPTYFMLSKEILSQEKYSKIVCVVEGGESRGESSYIGLKKICELESKTENVNVLIQDAVRPYINPNLINSILDKLNLVNAVTLAIPSSDTVYVSRDGSKLESIPDRTSIFKAQTPQSFNLKTIYDAYLNLAESESFAQTDDTSVLKLSNPDENILILEGDVDNIKITHPNDIEYFKQILLRK